MARFPIANNRRTGNLSLFGVGKLATLSSAASPPQKRFVNLAAHGSRRQEASADRTSGNGAFLPNRATKASKVIILRSAAIRAGERHMR